MNKKRSLEIILVTLAINAITVSISYGKDKVSSDSVIFSNYYRTFSFGLNSPTYRDFATSPLFYNGYGVYLQTSWVKESTRKERSLDIGLGFSGMSARIQKSDFLQPNTNAIFSQLTIRYQQLWQSDRFSNKRNNIKIGGVIQTSQNLRLNLEFDNSALGFENISNIMASGQITRDISRTESRQINLWIYKPTLKPVKRELRLQFNFGIMNFNYRPGYTNVYVDEFNGLETNPIGYLLSNYKWSFFNGWRANSELKLITYLKNGNARSWSYAWDAISAPGRYEKFQMASHQIRYTYYFSTKKR